MLASPGFGVDAHQFEYILQEFRFICIDSTALGQRFRTKTQVRFYRGCDVV